MIGLVGVPKTLPVVTRPYGQVHSLKCENLLTPYLHLWNLRYDVGLEEGEYRENCLVLQYC